MSNFISDSYNIFYSRNIHNCSNIWLSHNLQGCTECILCNGLENQSYCIKNKKYTKEEYHQLKKQILSDKSKFLSFYTQDIELKNFNTYNSNGKGLINCQDVENCKLLTNTHKAKNVILGGVVNASNMVNSIDVGINISDTYGCVSAGNKSNNLYFCGEISECSNIFYSYYLENCSYCLGCIGLKNKSFCILNKQYSKEERFEKANEIFEQMDTDGTLGKFFPGELNPFYFNDTAAYLIDDSFTKEEVEAEGYLWRDEEIKVDIPEGSEIVKSSDLDKYQGFDDYGKRYINPEILKKVIIDEKGNYYRIVKMEYDFLMKYGLPLPELHRLDRIKLGFKFK